MLSSYIDAWELRKLTSNGEIRPREVAEFYLARIASLNPKLGAFMTVTEDRALSDAERLENMEPSLGKMPLFGVPYSLKDLTWSRGIRTTLGSRNYAEFVPEVDAEFAARMERAGAILLGKTTTPEFGGRPTTEGGLCPTARNPWNLNYNAGGSSGGAAAAVAAGLGPVAEGGDGGGSIRGPAACCGIVGIKPSRGRITLAPASGESWGGFATRGPMARSVRDAALMLDVVAGPVVGDPYWAPRSKHSFVEAAASRPQELRIAAIGGTALSAVDPEIGAAFQSACATFAKLGHRVERIKLDPGAMLLDCARTLICVGVAAVPIKDPEWVDPVVRQMIDRGSKVSATEYVNLVTVMHNTARTIVQELAAYDALLTPTGTRPAVPNGTFPSRPDRYLDELWTWISFQFPFNATGQPAMSIPNGFTKSGLPIGLQIVGRPADDEGMIALAAQFEEACPWQDEHPPID